MFSLELECLVEKYYRKTALESIQNKILKWETADCEEALCCADSWEKMKDIIW